MTIFGYSYCQATKSAKNDFINEFKDIEDLSDFIDYETMENLYDPRPRIESRADKRNSFTHGPIISEQRVKNNNKQRSYGQNPNYGNTAAYYNFGYGVTDEYNKLNFGHKESRDGATTKGSYHVLLPDGRLQTVTYYVDEYGGYNAKVEYSGKAKPAPAPYHHKGHKGNGNPYH